MKRVITNKPTDTIDINDCHENDGKIYVHTIADIAYMLVFNEKEGYYQWLKIGGRLIKNSCLYNFRGALSDVRNLTQLDNLDELADWLKNVSK